MMNISITSITIFNRHSLRGKFQFDYEMTRGKDKIAIEMFYNSKIYGRVNKMITIIFFPLELW